MTKREAERWHHTVTALEALGLSWDEINTLRRIEMTLRAWATLECGNSNDYASWAIERDEKDDKPYMVRFPYQGDQKTTRTPIADREKGALKRLDAIMTKYPKLVRYHQGDPRGCALYIVRKSDIGNGDISSLYNRGVAVCC